MVGTDYQEHRVSEDSQERQEKVVYQECQDSWAAMGHLV